MSIRLMENKLWRITDRSRLNDGQSYFQWWAQCIVECYRTASLLLQGNHCIPFLLFHVLTKHKVKKQQLSDSCSQEQKIATQQPEKLSWQRTSFPHPSTTLYKARKSFTEILFFQCFIADIEF